MLIRSSLIAAVVATTSACAASRASGTHPEDMTATEHLEQAREASLRAASGSGYRPGPYYASPYSAPRYWSHWYPWYYYWDPAVEAAALADAHRAAAEELQIRYDSACALVPRELEGTSALQEYATGSDPLDAGVVVHLAPEAGPPDVVLAGLRCYRAWLMLERRDGTDDEPLLLDGVVLVAHAGKAGTELMLTVGDKDDVAELQRRTAAVLARGGDER
ncbi:MAG: hypothetical protein K8M05_31820 [Deltaproteobacteria bacterium]|nr:hypothetical protein [Kofleriaceae bacterium]